MCEFSFRFFKNNIFLKEDEIFIRVIFFSPAFYFTKQFFKYLLFMILLLNFSVLSWFIYWAGWPLKRLLPSDQNITEKRVLRKWFRQLLIIPWDLTRPLWTSQIFQSKYFFWFFFKGLCHNFCFYTYSYLKIFQPYLSIWI